jgi:hypothetical protein
MKTHRDFRSLSEDAQAEVRRQAFRNLDRRVKPQRFTPNENAGQSRTLVRFVEPQSD